MGWLIAFVVISSIAMIPVGIRLSYEKEKFTMKIRVLFFSFSLPKGRKEEEKPEMKVLHQEDSSVKQKLQEEQNQLQSALARKKEAKALEKEARKLEKEAALQEKKLEKKLQGPQPKQITAEEKPQDSHSEQVTEAQKPRVSIKAYLPFVKLAVQLLQSLRRKLRIDRLYAKVILAGDDPCDLATTYGCAWAGASNIQALLNRLFVVKQQDINIECDFVAEKTLISAAAEITITIGRLLDLAVKYGILALKEFLIFKKRKGGAEI